jgi:hypothetical protein
MLRATRATCGMQRDVAVQDATGSLDRTTGYSHASRDSRALTLGRLGQVLSGEVRMALHLEFLFRHNHSDLLLLKQMKGSV